MFKQVIEAHLSAKRNAILDQAARWVSESEGGYGGTVRHSGYASMASTQGYGGGGVRTSPASMRDAANVLRSELEAFTSKGDSDDTAMAIDLT